ncbi:sister chromatid cohesion 1 protein 3-like [Trifolium pratense]|uniref:sister chromatid cohesion 1 protein 3-like n=1 Tax=Trifolium pratense TaxID=57577 RepID=UPI001E692B2C|nr:sister chromatid cohesion 1 protein 3-like [Trifolium pratense]
MFYSQTFLARKGPLSTVWIAAHLQHRLKKSQWASTDIPSTVQHIMDPGVPIALRMSAHLLLGVVRIYSKKVDYLLNDCNAVRTVLYKVFPSMPNNTLPEDARQAPVHSITMPATFDLDMLDVDYEIDTNGSEDVHMRTYEEITITDENYVIPRFDEGERFGDLNEQPPPDSEAPTTEIIIPQSPSTNEAMPVDVQDGSPSTRRESHTGDDNQHIFQDPNTKETMPVEAFRNPSNDHDTIGNLPDPGSNDTEPNRDFNPTVNEEDPIVEVTEVRVETPQVQPTGPPTPVSIQEGASDAHVNGGEISQQTAGGHGSFDFGMIPSPQIEQRQDQGQDQGNQRGRKRKFIDDAIVLTNEFMRKNLNDTRKIRRKRKDVTTLGNWELKSKRLKEDVFDQPLFTGLCKELINIHKREYILSKPHLVISEEDHPDNTTRTSPINEIADEPIPDAPEIIGNGNPPPNPGVEDIERMRSDANASPPIIPTHSIDTEPVIEDTTYKSPVRRDDATPSVSETVEIPSYGATSPRARVSEIGTPSTYQDTIIHDYDIPDTNRLINSPENEDLYFLEEDNNTPATSSSQSTNKSISTLSGRSRGVAQYLKDYSPCTPIPEHPAEDLSLNKILDGKTRKIAARMFFEVLVLKTHDLIDVKQEEPYGDVSIKLTPTLSKAKI